MPCDNKYASDDAELAKARERYENEVAFIQGIELGRKIYASTLPVDGADSFRYAVNFLAQNRIEPAHQVEVEAPGKEKVYAWVVAGVLEGMGKTADLFGHKTNAGYASEAFKIVKPVLNLDE